ncbi:phenylacetic acid degradation protein [Oceanicola sp. 22II-s10i]|uniref:PaaI family thioesterase n=1 Tax=Oceanicola sp. 22II-s10i TaxID=1317116 RepID=UPI000B51F55D|nr:PaaI family thioesterase [Oceanicola sp. 22II-s10i]OWU83252.1 phenylacetic acid degradation protein [Oceanicola sp. 22II-s10i]
MTKPFETRSNITRLLGIEFISSDPEAGTIELAYHPEQRMTNPRGDVQGGVLAALLDNAMARALATANEDKIVASTVDMNVSFLRPVKPGRVIGIGRVIRQGRTICFLEAELFDVAGTLLARGTSTAIPVPIPGT